MMVMTYLKEFTMMPKTYEETYNYGDDLFEKDILEEVSDYGNFNPNFD